MVNPKMTRGFDNFSRCRAHKALAICTVLALAVLLYCRLPRGRVPQTKGSSQLIAEILATPVRLDKEPATSELSPLQVAGLIRRNTLLSVSVMELPGSHSISVTNKPTTVGALIWDCIKVNQQYRCEFINNQLVIYTESYPYNFHMGAKRITANSRSKALKMYIQQFANSHPDCRFIAATCIDAADDGKPYFIEPKVSLKDNLLAVVGTDGNISFELSVSSLGPQGSASLFLIDKKQFQSVRKDWLVWLRRHSPKITRQHQ
jgi:hypothetical protein